MSAERVNAAARQIARMQGPLRNGPIVCRYRLMAIRELTQSGGSEELRDVVAMLDQLIAEADAAAELRLVTQPE